MLYGFTSRLAELSNSLEVDMETDTGVATILSNKSKLKTRIKVLNSRVYELKMMILADEMYED